MSWKVNPKAISHNLFFGFIALFILSGNLKDDPRLKFIPIDLTLLSASVLLLVVITSLFKNYRNGGQSRTLFILLFIALILPGVLLRPDTPYGAEKSLHLSTLSLLAFMAGLETGIIPNSIEPFFKWKSTINFYILVDGIQLLLSSGGTLNRLTSSGGNTIGLGRTAGFLFLYGGTLFLKEEGGTFVRGWGMGLALVSGCVAVMAGSKGPILAAVAGLIVFMVIAGGRRASMRLLVFSGLLVYCLVLAWGLIPAESLSRIIGFTHGEYGHSGKDRYDALVKGCGLILENPLGIGWGGFNRYMPIWAGDKRQYVHNVIIEVFLEGGWVTGIGLTYLVSRAMKNAKLFLGKSDYGVWLALGTFTLLNAAVSGDVNDNRLLWVLTGYGLALNRPWAVSGEETYGPYPEVEIAELSTR